MKQRYRKKRSWRKAGIPAGTTPVLSLNPLRLSRVNNEDARRGEYVYVIRAGDSVKIGVSVSPWSRFDGLQTGSDRNLEMVLLIRCSEEIGKKGVEAALHKALGSSRIRGEWFDVAHAGVRRLVEQPHTLPWKVIGGMVGMGADSVANKRYPPHVRATMKADAVRSVKRQFEAREWAKEENLPSQR